MGVIAVETRTIERVVPADPANPAFVRTTHHGGWPSVALPNSSVQTGPSDLRFQPRERPRHLLCLQNWRGFSGGQQDMYDEVLKQGLKNCRWAVGVQAASFRLHCCQTERKLRGGAWVVLDPSINADGQMEMYADVEARAGVLEPEGIVEIKMRRDKIGSVDGTHGFSVRRPQERQ